MINEIFVAVLAVFYVAVLSWGFRHFPGEKWQILATLPWRKSEAGHWHGTNLTAYGLITASAYVISLIVLFILIGALQVALTDMMIVAAVLLAIVTPASRWVARLIEGKPYGFTVGGAAFVGIVIAPWLLVAANRFFLAPEAAIPLIPTLAAFAIAYAFGEGTGRLACISFGCCYGKPLAQCHPVVQKIFKDKHFVFQGKIKKIAWEGKMDGEKVVPIQAVTCVIYVATGLLATLLFLYAHYTAALMLALVVTQAWRVFSEMLRADFRGGWQKLSAYQLLALAGIPYVAAIAWLFPTGGTTAPDVLRGLNDLWQPGMILFIQIVWLASFLYSGRSMVTSSLVSFQLHEDRI